MSKRSELLAAISALKEKGDHTTWNGQLPRAREIFQNILELDLGEDISFEEDFIWFRDQLDLAGKAETEHYKALLDDVEDEPAPEPVSSADSEPGLIDTAEAERMLALLGIDKVIACAYGSTNLFTPRRQGDRYDWEKVPTEVDWTAVERDLKRNGTKNLGFISCPGGTRVVDQPGKPGEIFECSLLVYEIDGLPKDQQWGLWEKVGFEPTLVMDTGNNSLHCWSRLSKPLTPQQGRNARKRLSLAIEAVLPEGGKTDWSMHSTHQPARLAGGIHPKTGNRSTIVLATGKIHDFDELMALCPALPERTVGVSAGDVFNEGPEPDAGEEFPSFPLEAAPPLTLALSKKTQDLIKQGQKPGMGTGRPLVAFRLLKTLQASEEMFRAVGQEEFEGSWQELFGQFVINSDLYNGEVDTAIDKHWSEDCGAGELSRTFFLRKLRKWARDNCHWRDSWEKNLGSRRWSKTKVEVSGALVHSEAGSNDDESEDDFGQCGPMPNGDNRANQWFKERWEDRELRGQYFYIDNHSTLEQKVEVAFLELFQHLGQPITNHDNRFLEYVPGAGYYKFMPMSVVKNAVAELLQFFYTYANRKKPAFKQSTEAKCKACVGWLNIRLDEPQMNVIDGIAFTNGTYRLDTGKLVPHSPQFLLTWAIQGQFSPAGGCPPEFRKFVCSSFGEEWLEIIQMTLRYIVDPTFKPSKIVIILGPSGSGKGTLERLIEKIFPQDCISVITSSFQDINHPDKIRQFVRGKRLVVFPDLQGRQHGVGTIYSMVDGGLLTSRALHEAEADAGEAFNGRVVICSTQPPSMEDAGNGMTRRMHVLRTLDRTNEEPDHDLDDKLEAELGEIVSWALQADVADVKEMLRRGDAAGLLQQASTQAEVQMDPIRSFIDQCLEVKDPGVSPSDVRLFTAFKIFCHDQKHRPTAQRTFINRLKAALPHLRIERMSVPGSRGQRKTTACFFGVGLRANLFHDHYEGGHKTDLIGIRDDNGYLDRNQYGEGGLDSLRSNRPAVPSIDELVERQHLKPFDV